MNYLHSLYDIYYYFFPLSLDKFYYLSLIKEEGDNNWSIHGLWPQNTPTDYPTYCKRVSFNINQLNPIMDKLQKYWYSTEEKNEDFWKHEWQKHGSCVFVNITEFNYFNITLKLYEDAIKMDIPKEYYDEKTKKCLIPVNQDFVFYLQE